MTFFTKKSGFFELNPKYERCLSPGHEPPNMLHIPRGTAYRHICPSCKQETVLYPTDTILDL